MEFGAKVPPPPQAPDHTFERAEVEKEKKNIELELENLTTALFEEANKVDTQSKPNLVVG